MQQTQPIGPIGQEFESIVQLLPPWALVHEFLTIEKVRKAIKEYELGDAGSARTKHLTTAKSVV